MIRSLVVAALFALFPLLAWSQPVTGTGPDKATLVQMAAESQHLNLILKSWPLSNETYEVLSKSPEVLYGLMSDFIGEIPADWSPEEVMASLLTEHLVQHGYTDIPIVFSPQLLPRDEVLWELQLQVIQEAGAYYFEP